jgi:hypothetical protein
MLLNKINWKVNIYTAFDLMTILLESFIDSSEVKSTIADIKDTAMEWIAYCMNEYQIYQRYDQFTVTLAAILNTFLNEDMIRSAERLKHFMGLISVDKSVVLECMNDMFIQVNQSDKDESVSNDACSTSASSEVLQRSPSVETNGTPEKEVNTMLGRKRVRVQSKRRLSISKQTKIPQFMKLEKAISKCGRKKS